MCIRDSRERGLSRAGPAARLRSHVIVLFMGDVVGKPGVLAVRTLLPRLIARHEVDLVIANAENSEGGAGISGESAEALLAAEVNLLTSGNHFWTKRQILPW